MDYAIFPPEELIETSVRLPLSKSLSNRALLMRALTSSPSPDFAAADCDDTRAMLAALAPDAPAEVNVGAAGTAMRFLTAYFASYEGRTVTLDGSPRMRRRPIGALVDALRQCGASIDYLGEDGFPPLRITGRRLSGGELTMDADISSQFVSALLMVAPLMSGGLTLHLDGQIISRPYILMTLAMMRRRGIECELERTTITVAPGSYQPVTVAIEGDWSAAAFWYELVAISAGWVTLRGLKDSSLQGDSRAREIFAMLGVATAPSEETADALDLCADPEVFSRVDLDLAETPDLAQAVVATCCMVGVPFHLTGLASLRIKETDRLEALRCEMEKIGCTLQIDRGSELIWDGKRHPIFELPVFSTYDDHRMAMCLAPLSVFIPGIVVRDAEVVSKSYPEYWDHMRAAGFRLLDPEEAARLRREALEAEGEEGCDR